MRSVYRHIDAAAVYGNEKEVGDGIRASGIARADIFVWKPRYGEIRLTIANSVQVTGKLWNTHHRTEDVERQLDILLANLQTDYLDLFLVRLKLGIECENGC